MDPGQLTRARSWPRSAWIQWSYWYWYMINPALCSTIEHYMTRASPLYNILIGMINLANDGSWTGQSISICAYMTWDRGDTCPWYTDCQQLRDETSAVSCTRIHVGYSSREMQCYTSIVLPCTILPVWSVTDGHDHPRVTIQTTDP